jgi:hypothetical protein
MGGRAIVERAVIAIIVAVLEGIFGIAGVVVVAAGAPDRGEWQQEG